MAPYQLVACQTRTELVFAEDGRFLPAAFARNVAHYCDLIDRAARDHDARLVIFPQFGLTGYAPGLKTADWLEASVLFPGSAIAPIMAATRGAGVHVAFQAVERHDAFPGRYFLSCAILKPDGEVGMVYRKNYSLSLRTSPVDVQDDFERAFGTGAFFPVLDTSIGKLAVAIGLEVQFPEVVRSLALRGAELLINPVAAGPTLDYIGRKAAGAVHAVRALENGVYVAMVNRPSQPGVITPEIYDYDGNLIAKGEESGLFTVATIDIAALRAARERPGMNYIAQLQPSIHEDRTALGLWPRHAFRVPASSHDELFALVAGVWPRLEGE